MPFKESRFVRPSWYEDVLNGTQMLTLWEKQLLMSKEKEITLTTWRFPFTRRSFIKATDISPLMFEVRTQTFTTRQTTAGVDHKSPRSCAECLSAHYTVGRSDLQAPYCLTWRSYATAASQQVKRGPIQHLIKSAASIKTSTLSGSKGHTPNLNYSIKLPEFFSVRQTVTLNSRRRLNKWTHILQRI